MVSWNNLDTLASFKELANVKPACLTEVMSGDSGADRVKKYSIPMAAGLSYNYASKQVDEDVLSALEKLADEAQLADKFKALYNGEVVNTGEKRLVLHHMTRGSPVMLLRFRIVREGLTALKKVTVRVQPASRWTSWGISERMTWSGTLISVTL